MINREQENLCLRSTLIYMKVEHAPRSLNPDPLIVCYHRDSEAVSEKL